MVEKRTIDDRSMGEILASIRKIVTHEETSRRNGMKEPHLAATADDAGPLVLTYDMRAKAASDQKPAPKTDFSGALKAGAAPSSAAPSDTPAAKVPAPGPTALPASSSDEEIIDPVSPQDNETGAVSAQGHSGFTLEDIEAIVRRVVREELQGPIGMQINRKVKRMVREEVTSAMDNDSIL